MKLNQWVDRKTPPSPLLFARGLGWEEIGPGRGVLFEPRFFEGEG